MTRVKFNNGGHVNASFDTVGYSSLGASIMEVVGEELIKELQAERAEKKAKQIELAIFAGAGLALVAFAAFLFV